MTVPQIEETQISTWTESTCKVNCYQCWRVRNKRVFICLFIFCALDCRLANHGQLKCTKMPKMVSVCIAYTKISDSQSLVCAPLDVCGLFLVISKRITELNVITEEFKCKSRQAPFQQKQPCFPITALIVGAVPHPCKTIE